MLRPEESSQGISALALSRHRQVGQKSDGFPGIDRQRIAVDLDPGRPEERDRQPAHERNECSAVTAAVTLSERWSWMLPE